MKKLILGSLMFFSTVVSADPAYPHPEQFKEYNVKNTDIYILKDTVTGCEYITRGKNDSYVLREGSCNKSVQKG